MIENKTHFSKPLLCSRCKAHFLFQFRFNYLIILVFSPFACHAGGREFEPRRPRQLLNAGLATLVRPAFLFSRASCASVLAIIK